MREDRDSNTNKEDMLKPSNTNGQSNGFVLLRHGFHCGLGWTSDRLSVNAVDFDLQARFGPRQKWRRFQLQLVCIHSKAWILYGMPSKLNCNSKILSHDTQRGNVTG
jgi:hypothetical protein